MSRMLTLELPEPVERALDEEAARTAKSREQVALEWIASRIEPAPRGTVDAILPSCGAWTMTADERARIEQMIAQDRLLGETHR